MDLNKIIEQLIPLGVVEFNINGRRSYPTSYNRSHNRFTIDDQIYSLSDKIEIISINMNKVNSMMSVFKTLISEIGIDVGILDLKEFQSKLVLKELDGLDNDIDRLKFIQETLVSDLSETVIKSSDINDDDNNDEIMSDKELNDLDELFSNDDESPRSLNNWDIQTHLNENGIEGDLSSILKQYRF